MGSNVKLFLQQKNLPFIEERESTLMDPKPLLIESTRRRNVIYRTNSELLDATPSRFAWWLNEDNGYTMGFFSE